MDFLKDNPIIYVARDIERAQGLPAGQEGYTIISNQVTEKNGELLDTHELLASQKVKSQIDTLVAKNPKTAIVVFKNTAIIEAICKKNGWRLLNPNAVLSQKIEEKVSQIEWLGPLTSYLPPHQIIACKNLSFTGEPFIIQFNHAHSGLGTLLIEKESDLADIKTKFPERLVRKTAYVEGPMFTSNNIVTADSVLAGNVSYQITGLAPFTDGRFTTVGNDWALPHVLLSQAQKKQYKDMVTAIGSRLRESGWKGLFGIDAVLSKKTGRLYLIEINARQPASSPYESALQRKSKNSSSKSETVFSAHLKALLSLRVEDTLAEITDGAQIVQRATQGFLKNFSSKTKEEMRKIAAELEKEAFHAVLYENKSPESDILRVQSDATLMESESTLNVRGELIRSLVSSLSK